MRIERDESKAASNVKRRRVSFDDAVTIFCDLLAATFGDPDHSQDESRLIAVGGEKGGGRKVSGTFSAQGERCRVPFPPPLIRRTRSLGTGIHT